MAQKYAKDQPAGFTNRIEKVVIVGASLVPITFIAAINHHRLEDDSASTSRKSYSRPASTR